MPKASAFSKKAKKNNGRLIESSHLINLIAHCWVQLMEIALELKESKHYDLAVKLLKEQDPEVQDDPDASYFVKMEIMHILYLQACTHQPFFFIAVHGLQYSFL